MLAIEKERALQQRLSSFSCPINTEIEDFIKYKALDFAKRKLSITYLILDETANLLGYFTLTQQAIEVRGENLSNTVRRKLSAHSKFEENDNSYTTSAFLLAQIGKKDFGICIFTRGIITLTDLNYTEAEQFFQDAERIFQHKMPQSNDYLENVRHYLYTLYMQQGRYSLADSYKTK